MEEEVYKGYLLFPATGKLLMKKSWQQKYCYLYKASKFGLARLEIFDSIDSKIKGAVCNRIITLENCIKISSENDLRFTVTTKTQPLYEFNAVNGSEKSLWLGAFQSVAFPDDMSVLTSIEEDNELYCSFGQGIFNVTIHPSDASERCNLKNICPYTLVLTSTAMQLKTSLNGNLLYTWPYRFIRRYGYKSGKFTFEAGRKCDSGEGTFYLEHSNQQEIFRCLSNKMKSMKKLLNKDSSNGLLDCGDNQFQAALSMEARSRSPLPPSPTSSTKLHDIESTQEVKPKPAKPPRKSLVKRLDYEVVDKYDEVEVRNDAWKTLGMDEGGPVDNEDEVYLSWGDCKSPITNKAPTIIRQINKSDDSYDKLDFFGSTNKLEAKSGYKQFSVSSGLNCPPSMNDYDEVLQPAMEEIRLADDKHLGYALVRKRSEQIDHHFRNNEPYAVISKPKRV